MKFFFLVIYIEVITLFLRIIAVPLVFIATLFAKTYDDKILPDGVNVRRYKLPKWAEPLETPDQSLPGGLYVPAVMKIYKRYGWRTTAVNWLGTRNVGFGLAWQYGKPASNYMTLLNGKQKKAQGVWEVEKRILGIWVIFGYAIYRDWYSKYTDNGFWAVPRISLRLKNN